MKQNMAAICDALYTQFQEDCLVDVITVFRHLEKGSFLGDCFAMNVVGLTEMWWAGEAVRGVDNLKREIKVTNNNNRVSQVYHLVSFLAILECL